MYVCMYTYYYMIENKMLILHMYNRRLHDVTSTKQWTSGYDPDYSSYIATLQWYVVMYVYMCIICM